MRAVRKRDKTVSRIFGGIVMQHSFDVSIAKKYGIESAIILNNMYFWHNRNKANNKHFHDGKYWIYNSVSAWNELFDYMSRDKIKNTLTKLKEQDLIITGNYNEVKYDRTLWYALTDLALSILQNQPMEFAESTNGICRINQPIPIINTIIKPIINTIHDNEKSSTEIWYQFAQQLGLQLSDEIKLAIDTLATSDGYSGKTHNQIRSTLMKIKMFLTKFDEQQVIGSILYTTERGLDYLNEPFINKKQNKFLDVNNQTGNIAPDWLDQYLEKSLNDDGVVL